MNKLRASVRSFISELFGERGIERPLGCPAGSET